MKPNGKIDTAILSQNLNSLFVEFPEIADDPELWKMTLESETDLFEFLRTMEDRRQDAARLSDSLGEHIEALKARRNRLTHRAEAIKNLMFSLLETARLRTIELPEATLSIRKGVPKVMITNESEIPNEFCRIKREPDKLLIAEALKAHEDVPGTTLSNSPDYLAIRIR